MDPTANLKAINLLEMALFIWLIPLKKANARQAPDLDAREIMESGSGIINHDGNDLVAIFKR